MADAPDAVSPQDAREASWGPHAPARGPSAGPGRGSAGATRPPGYYGLPAIRRPHWEWQVPLYFFLGGLASGSYLLALAADLWGGERARPVVRAGRYLAALAALASPPLLIADLGRPERAHHMFRLIKPLSALSNGAWALLAVGVYSGLLAAFQLARDRRLLPTLVARLRPYERLVALLGAPCAAFLGSYTGVLLAATAVPLWARSRLALGPLFLASAFSSAAAALALLVGRGRDRNAAAPLRTVETVALAAEASLLVALDRALGPEGDVLRGGGLGRLRLALLGGGLAFPLAVGLLDLAGRSAPHAVRTLAGLLALAGGLALRFLWVRAGQEQADDPAPYLRSAARPAGR